MVYTVECLLNVDQDITVMEEIQEQMDKSQVYLSLHAKKGQVAIKRVLRKLNVQLDIIKIKKKVTNVMIVLLEHLVSL